jgi:hypothetical protein
MSGAATRGRLSRALRDELHRLGERSAIAIDGGLGVSAVAAIAALPRGPARAVEAARWARRAATLVDTVVTPISPRTTDDELDAMTELHTAIANERSGW